MAITITPQYPVAGEALTISVDNPTGNEIVFFVSTMPTVSEVLAGMIFDGYGNDRPGDGLTQRTTKLQTVIDNDGVSASFTPDVSGVYTLIAYETRKIQGIPAFPGDPNGAIVQELSTTQTNAIYVGELVDLPLLTAGGDGATLRFQVNNATIRGASLVDHRSTAASVAAAQTAVTAALTACVGVAVASVGTDLVTAVNDLRVQYEAHRVRVAGAPPNVHIAADTTNVTTRSAATDQIGAMTLLDDIYAKLIAHMQNSSSSGAAWHAGSLDDLENMPLAPQCYNLATATVLCADLRFRAYNEHRRASIGPPLITPAVHTAEDTVNVLTVAASKLDDVIVAFFNALAAATATAKYGENQGEIDLLTKHGFARST